MARSINESLTVLDTSLNDVKTKLSEKLSGGGSLPDKLKVSDISQYIEQIETGGGDDFTCTFNSVYCYMNADDDESKPSAKLIITPYTVNSDFYFYGYISTVGFKKIIFNLTINNAPTSKDNPYSKDNIFLLGDFLNNSHTIETEGDITSGSGDLKITIKYSDDWVRFYSNTNRPIDFCFFKFGDNGQTVGNLPTTLDKSKIVHFSVELRDA